MRSVVTTPKCHASNTSSGVVNVRLSLLSIWLKLALDADIRGQIQTEQSSGPLEQQATTCCLRYSSSCVTAADPLHDLKLRSIRQQRV